MLKIDTAGAGTATDVDGFMEWVADRNPGETNFLQSVRESAEILVPFAAANPDYRDARILERLTEPDRVVTFRVVWEDDQGAVHINRGARVQFSSAIGPYKGGLRFREDLTLDVLKFLGYEQIFKNALTGLPLGAGKGGADFNPAGRSDREIMRFCHGFMTELQRHIGEDTDIPAGDINVGGREIGYLFGAYKRINNRFNGVITGKAQHFGGTFLRPEATGYGLVAFVRTMLSHHDEALEGKTVAISGSGNVAGFAAERAIQRGAKVVTLSDSRGTIHDPDGLTEEKVAWVQKHKAKRGASLEDYTSEFGGTWHAGKKPWGVKCDVALPCATQNELDVEDAKCLIDQGVRCVGEGANMPSTPEAVAAFKAAGVLFGPAKAANAGGVAISGLEMSQNAQRKPMTNDELCQSLEEIMTAIHGQCVAYGADGDQGVDYNKGATIAGFRKVADAMLAFGVM